MLRLILSGVLATAIIYIGMGIKRYYKVRAVLLGDINSFVERLQQEISFLKPPVNKIIDGFCAGKKSEFNRVVTQSMCATSAKDINCAYMQEQEKSMLIDMMTSVTKLDCKTLLNNLEGYKLRFSAIAATAKDKSNKLGQLSFKLSVMAAILAMILIA